MADQIQDMKERLYRARREWSLPHYNAAIVRNFLMIRHPLFPSAAYGACSTPTAPIYKKVLDLCDAQAPAVSRSLFSDAQYVMDAYLQWRRGTERGGGEEGSAPARTRYDWPAYRSTMRCALQLTGSALAEATTYFKLLFMPLQVYMDAVFDLRNPNGTKEGRLKRELMRHLTKSLSPSSPLHEIFTPNETWCWNARAATCLMAPLVPVAKDILPVLPTPVPGLRYHRVPTDG